MPSTKQFVKGQIVRYEGKDSRWRGGRVTIEFQLIKPYQQDGQDMYAVDIQTLDGRYRAYALASELFEI